MFDTIKVVDDSQTNVKTRRIVAVGKFGPGLANVVVVASFAEAIDTHGEEVSNEKSA